MRKDSLGLYTKVPRLPMLVTQCFSLKSFEQGCCLVCFKAVCSLTLLPLGHPSSCSLQHQRREANVEPTEEGPSSVGSTLDSRRWCRLLLGMKPVASEPSGSALLVH